MNQQKAYIERISRACADLDIHHTQEQMQQLQDYTLLIQKWNKTYNITALRNIEDILVQHIFDSLSAVSAVISSPLYSDRSKTDTACQHIQATRILDVGSGGGLPGVVFAIMQPQWQVVCIDAVEKKTAFITLVAGILNLNNLNSKHSRIQDYPNKSADIVISRAFASLADFAEWSGHCVMDNGFLLSMKANLQEAEILELTQRTSWVVKQDQILTVPELKAQRCLIWMKRA